MTGVRPRRLSEQLYRSLLVAYPAEFRRVYGIDAAAVFGRLHQDTWHDEGLLAVIGLWRRSAWQVVRDGIRERWATRRNSNPTTKPPNRRDNWLRRWLSDMRYAQRALRKGPGFTIGIILITGLGIGAATTIFSVVDNVLLRPLPYEDARELVTITKSRGSVPIPDYLDLRDRITSFASIAAQFPLTVDLTNDGEPERLNNGQVTKDYFKLFNATSVAGRLLLPGDYTPDAPPVTVLSHGTWQRRWGSDPAVIGAVITLNGQPVEVVGVVDPDFQSPGILGEGTVDLWTPLDLSTPRLQHRRMGVLGVAARLNRGVTVASAHAELDGLSRLLAAEYPNGNRTRDGDPTPFPVVGLLEATVGNIAPTLYLLLGAVGLLLLIAYANVANLLLARGMDRRREMALRSALGAKRSHIVGQQLTESVMTSLLGGAVGMGIAFTGIHVISIINMGSIPRIESVSVDWRVLAFAVALSVLTGVLSGILPALRCGTTDVSRTLIESARSTTSGRRSSRLRSALVVCEISLALVLLVGAGLLFNSFVHLNEVDPGIHPDDVSVMSFRLGSPLGVGSRYDDPAAAVGFLNELLSRSRSIPGISHVGAALVMPLMRGRCCWNQEFAPLGQEDSLSAWVHPVTPGFFETLGTRMYAGRPFSTQEADTPPDGDGNQEASYPGVINRTLARRWWGEENPVGRRLGSGSFTVVIVGVIDDIRHFGLGSPDQYDLYLPLTTVGMGFGMFELAVRSTAGDQDLGGALRDVVRSIDPNLPAPPMYTMRDRLSQSIVTPRFYSVLLGAFATVAFLLAAAGIYASMLYSVGQRQRELGIRLALGARAPNLVAMVVRNGLNITILGVVLGLGGALALSRFLEAHVFGITTTDPATFAVVAVMLGAVSMAACFFPARRAAAADPLQVLKAE